MSTHKLEFSLQFVPLASILIISFEGKTSSFIGIFHLQFHQTKVYLIPCLSLFILKMCFSFAEFEKNIAFEV